MIRFGPAGIPLSCKGRTLRDGVEDVHGLSLTAMEIQMVRAETLVFYPEEEEIGLTMKDIEDRLVVEILRDGESIVDPDESIEEDDELVCISGGNVDNFGELYEIADLARRLDVSMSLHTPYYMDFASNNELTNICIESLMHAGVITNALGGTVVTTNLGLYGEGDPEDLDANIYDNIAGVMEWWKDNGLKPKLGIEITGQQNVFGSLEQVLDICDQIDGLVPVINWPHYHSRTSGSLLEIEDFKYVMDQVGPYCGGTAHSLFAGVEHRDGNELRLTPIKKGDLKFDTLAECLVEYKPDITIISSSPLLEHDAMYMRIIHERYLVKRVGKLLRQRKKEEAEAVAAADE